MCKLDNTEYPLGDFERAAPIIFERTAPIDKDTGAFLEQE